MQVLEKEIEDWVCQNLDHFFPSGKAELVGRQIRLPNGGILDVLVAECVQESENWTEVVVTVVEIKRDEIDGAAVLQLPGYLGAIRDAREADCSDHWRRPGVHVELCGLLIGQSLSTEAAWCLRAMEDPEIRFAQIKPQFSACVWESIAFHTVTDQQREACAMLVAAARDGVLVSPDPTIIDAE